jgi:hypothetical protein
VVSYVAPRRFDLMTRRVGSFALWLGIIGVALFFGLFWPPTSAWMRQKLGFVAYAIFYLVSPVILPPPSPRFFAPDLAADGLPGLAATLAVVALLWRTRRWLAARSSAAYCVVLMAAALIPVLSLTGSPRYVYLSTAGAAVLVGVVFRTLSGRARTAAAVVIAGVLVASVAQLVAAASAWRWSSQMVRDGLALMTAEIEPCGTRDVVLLTAPKGLRGVYPNFYWDAFKVTSGCTPASLGTLMIVQRIDARVEMSRPSPDVFDLRVPSYEGNLVASSDLRSYDHPVSAGTRATIETVAGPLETWPDGAAQVFRFHPTAGTRTARFFYYSDGRMRPVVNP